MVAAEGTAVAVEVAAGVVVAEAAKAVRAPPTSRVKLHNHR